MRGSGWVHVKYIEYYEQLISCTWLMLPKAAAVCAFRRISPATYRFLLRTFTIPWIFLSSVSQSAPSLRPAAPWTIATLSAPEQSQPIPLTVPGYDVNSVSHVVTKYRSGHNLPNARKNRPGLRIASRSALLNGIYDSQIGPRCGRRSRQDG